MDCKVRLAATINIELPEEVEPDEMRAVRLFVANVLAIWRYRPGAKSAPDSFAGVRRRRGSRCRGGCLLSSCFRSWGR